LLATDLRTTDYGLRTNMTASKSELDTPMMQQYQAAKAAHPGMLLLFRNGDFYETFCDDAELASRLLELKLTRRGETIPMAGFPHHQLERYLHSLLHSCHCVAICDQVENPAQAKRVIRRDQAAAWRPHPRRLWLRRRAALPRRRRRARHLSARNAEDQARAPAALAAVPAREGAPDRRSHAAKSGADAHAARRQPRRLAA